MFYVNYGDEEVAITEEEETEALENFVGSFEVAKDLAETIESIADIIMEDEELIDEIQAEITWMNTKGVDRTKNILQLVVSKMLVK